jgi:ABC-type transport system involved in multi-copper enzyme maturation permease subunit
MSTIPPPTTDPTPPAPPVDALRAGALVETAPSAVVAEGPMFPRLVGFVGLFAFVLGAVVVVTTRAIGPRWVSEGYGFLAAGFGVAFMLYHAASDAEQEVRRMYGGFAVGLLAVAVLSAVLPGPFDAPGGSKAMGYYLLPWGVAAGLLSLMFAVPFTRHETDDGLRNIVSYGMLGVGALLCVGVVVAGLFNPDFLAGKGLALALLGLGFVCAYLGQVETAEGLGYAVAFALGAIGAAVAFYAFGRTVFPTVLYEGPGVLRKANQALDQWRAAGRAAVILAFLGVLALGALGKFPVWLKASLAAVGLIGTGVFVAASTGTYVTAAPKPFMVPGGLILGALGLLYLAVSLGICSDSQFVTLVRRELAAYFLSPIGYMVLAGMVLALWFGYLDFVNRLIRFSAGGRGAAPEPIVQFYAVAIFPVFALTLMVPALTMRLFAEEKRTGTLEVMLTAPVNEWVVTLSKFLATWLFFLICWVPYGLFLLALKMEGGQAFDYRPLLGFYVALAATGAAFVAVGLFFSTITNNQIVAAVLTFVGMVFFLACYIFKDRDLGLGSTVQAFLGKFAYLDLWSESLSGQLPIRDVILWVSLAVFFVFLSIKVLETRRWS